MRIEGRESPMISPAPLGGAAAAEDERGVDRQLMVDPFARADFAVPDVVRVQQRVHERDLHLESDVLRAAAHAKVQAHRGSRGVTLTAISAGVLLPM